MRQVTSHPEAEPTHVHARHPAPSRPSLAGGDRCQSRRMAERPWRPPGRHWADRPEVVAGLDLEAGGSWLGVNDHGVAAAVLNRRDSLGPAPGKRSRGELVLDALDHADAVAAAEALARTRPAGLAAVQPDRRRRPRCLLDPRDRRGGGRHNFSNQAYIKLSNTPHPGYLHVQLNTVVGVRPVPEGHFHDRLRRPQRHRPSPPRPIKPAAVPHRRGAGARIAPTTPPGKRCCPLPTPNREAGATAAMSFRLDSWLRHLVRQPDRPALDRPPPIRPDRSGASPMAGRTRRRSGRSTWDRPPCRRWRRRRSRSVRDCGGGARIAIWRNRPPPDGVARRARGGDSRNPSPFSTLGRPAASAIA